MLGNPDMMKSTKWACMSLAALLLVGCAVRMVAPYDDETREATLSIAKQVDAFYLALLEEAEPRAYAGHAAEYIAIETELRALVLRNRVREMNAESVTISNNLLKLWTKHKAAHKEKDNYSTGMAKLNWDALTRAFGYALEAEEAKQDPTGTTGEGG